MNAPTINVRFVSDRPGDCFDGTLRDFMSDHPMGVEAIGAVRASWWMRGRGVGQEMTVGGDDWGDGSWHPATLTTYRSA